ncbi:MAG: DUF898 family protein [Deltaproteobacteria bacterium]|nr:DUF898 family protein [Deltaproteobacteria bacterium]
MDSFTCSDCGFSTNDATSYSQEFLCPRCGGTMEESSSPLERTPVNRDLPLNAGSVGRPGPQRIRTAFIGAGSEYFRIWIINLFLTIITLGIYGAWAKVRNRKYLYANTLIAAQPFDYLADPLAILKGNLIIAAGFIIYLLTQAYNPVYTGAVVILFYLVLPFLVYKSLRFLAHNSSFRNIRFHFYGTLSQSYKIYVLIPLLIPFTLGLITPYWAYRRKKYFFENMAFGTTPATFSGRAGFFYKVYAKALLLILAVVFGAGIFAAVLIPAAHKAFIAGQQFSPGIGFITSMVLIYLFMILGGTLIQQYIHARLTNYCWNESRIGQVKFRSSLKARNLFWIQFTNILAMIFSLGLLIPWAKIRKSRYVFDNMMVIATRGFDEFTAETEPEITALGDSATDFFDLEIGL